MKDPESISIFYNAIKAINIGSEIFCEALITQNVEVLQLEWSPPKEVKLDKQIIDILEKMGSL